MLENCTDILSRHLEQISCAMALKGYREFIPTMLEDDAVHRDALQTILAEQNAGIFKVSKVFIFGLVVYRGCHVGKYSFFFSHFLCLDS